MLLTLQQKVARSIDSFANVSDLITFAASKLENIFRKCYFCELKRVSELKCQGFCLSRSLASKIRVFEIDQHAATSLTTTVGK